MSNIIISDLDNFSASESRTCAVERCKHYLPSCNNSIIVLTQNIRSISKNFDNFCVFMQRLDINCDIFVLTECWLSTNCNLPHLPGYKIYKSLINYNQNDGIVIYVKNSLNFNVSVEEPKIVDCNRILISIGTDTAILAIYRPPAFKNVNIFIESLNSSLQKLTHYQNLILIGDININIRPDNCDSVAHEYLNVCSFHGMFPAHTLPTHQSGSCLDHIFLKSRFPSVALVTNSSLTDHSAALLTLNRKLPNITRTQNYKSQINERKLEDNLFCIDFDPLCNFDDADECMSYFINKVRQAISRSTIFTQSSNKNYNIKPWITPGLIRCMRHRDKLHMKAKSNPDNLILQISYKRYRNFCNDVLKKVKKSYDKKELEKAGTDSKRIWKVIKNVTHMSKQHESSSGLFQEGTSQLTSVNSANDYFVNIGKCLASKVQSHSFMSQSSIQHSCENSFRSFVLLDTDEAEVERIIMDLKDDSAVGWDNISNKMLKRYRHILVSPLTYIFRKCLAQGVFPKCLKKAVIIPVYKSGNKDQISNYRPISLLPAISKILEKIINIRLVRYFEKYSVFSRSQYGFRPKLSTADAVHQLTNYLVQELDKGNKTLGIFLDLAKAFDTVSVPILLLKLESLGIRGNQLKLLTSYLYERSQCVKINNVISSDLTNTSHGVPQGSILGPTLFLVYINDLCNLKLHGGKIISYADDTALLFSASSEEEVYEYAQRGFNVVNNWLQQHLLTLNADKTKYVYFSMRKYKTILTNPKLHAHRCKDPVNHRCTCPDIGIANNLKYLGVIIDENLSFKPHIEALCGRIRKLIYIFKKLRTVADYALIRQVYLALGQSIINYCITSWGGTSKTSLLSMERAQRAVLKVATFRPYLYSTELLYKNCNVLTVRQLFILSTILKQHTALPYSTEITNKRRKDRVCPQNTGMKSAFSSSFFMFLGPLLYNRFNAKFGIYSINYHSTRSILYAALQKMSYEDTEKLLLVIK